MKLIKNTLTVIAILATPIWLGLCAIVGETAFGVGPWDGSEIASIIIMAAIPVLTVFVVIHYGFKALGVK